MRTSSNFRRPALLRVIPRETLVDWGETKQAVTAYDLVTVNPNEGITNNPELKREAELLPQVAALVGSGRVEFLINIETQMEIWGLPNLDSETGRFYGAARRVVEAPADYNRIMFGGNASYKRSNSISCAHSSMTAFSNSSELLAPIRERSKSTEISCLMPSTYGVRSIMPATFF
ncbi:MAG: hypothetical protein QOJ42_7107 [Acidobacteriaceae bacterium]|jgi:hypothetical protein|nr:hypothetical protein [Acidobacteriaceae bacterium]